MKAEKNKIRKDCWAWEKGKKGNTIERKIHGAENSNVEPFPEMEY